MPETTTLIVYTGAPPAADYQSATTLDTFIFEDKPVRKVQIVDTDYRVKYQCARYGSFLGGRALLDDPREVPLWECQTAPTDF